MLGDEPFAVMTADVITRGTPGCLAQVLATYEQTGGNVLSVEGCRPEETGRYGIVGVGEAVSEDAFRITAMVEKPKHGAAPSNFKISGRYLLQPQVLTHLARQTPGAGGEIQLTDALAALSVEQPFYGSRFRGRSFDCGSREGFLRANIAIALDDPELAPLVRSELARIENT
jgi:UTP--glucose-1-phosphate uridylyltransferase